MFCRRERTDLRDLFAREVSINGDMHQRNFFVGDTCKFDIIRSTFSQIKNRKKVNGRLFFSASWHRDNKYQYITRAVSEISQLPKIPKKKSVVDDNKVSGDLFKATM